MTNIENAWNKLGRQLDNGSRKFFIYLLRGYQLFISPWFLPSCRYYPSCSHYAIDAYKKKDIFTASFLVLKRLSKCHPFGGQGYDPVPEKETMMNLVEIK